MTPEALAAKLDPARLKATHETLLNQMLAVAEANVKRVTPVKKGALRRSITSRVEQPGVRGVVGTNLNYAKIVHEGSRPHLITPKSAKALYWKGARYPVRKVRHPGTRGTPFLVMGLDMSRNEFEQLAAAAGAGFFSGVS